MRRPLPREQPWSVSDFEAPAQPGVALPAGFVPTCVAHPDAYVNKVLVCAADGRAALVNFVAGRVVHTFAGFGAAVRCVAPSPALDVVAFGLADGRVVVHNIRFDETVATFTHDPAGGAVTAAAFRTGPGPAVLVCGGVSGALSVWDLAAKRLQTVIKEAHDAPVRGPPVFCAACATRTHTHTSAPFRSGDEESDTAWFLSASARCGIKYRLQFAEPRERDARLASGRAALCMHACCARCHPHNRTRFTHPHTPPCLTACRLLLPPLFRCCRSTFSWASLC
jgi:hypothetical protein